MLPKQALTAGEEAMKKTIEKVKHDLMVHKNCRDLN